MVSILGRRSRPERRNGTNRAFPFAEMWNGTAHSVLRSGMGATLAAGKLKYLECGLSVVHTGWTWFALTSEAPMVG